VGRVNAGNIQVQADNLVEIIGTSADGIAPSGIIATSVPFIQGNAGQGGNIDIRTRNLRLRDGAEITASTFGQADAGDVFVRASNSIALDRSTISSTVNAGATGNAGSITFNTDSLSLDRSRISSSTAGQGNTGTITIQAGDRISLTNNSQITSTVNQGATGNSQRITLTTPDLSLRGDSLISASTGGNGSAGDVQILGADSVALSNSRISTQVRANGVVPTGNGDRLGNIRIETDALRLNNGSQITSSTNGRGRAGNVTVRNAETIALDDGSSLSTEVRRGGRRRGGNVSLDTEVLSLDDNSRITSSTNGRGRSGNVTVRNAETIELDGSTISASTNRRNRGGTVDLQTRDLTLTDRAAISSASTRRGRAGDINIQADGTLSSDDSDITTRSNNSAAGSIGITGGTLRLFGDSDIRTTVGRGQGGGGNITINADLLLAFDDSDVISAALDAGGDISFGNTIAFFENYDPTAATADPDTLENNDRADVNASGTEPGTISLTDTTFLQNSLADLADVAVNADSLIANSCIARTEQGGTFLVTGSGGLPERPGQPTVATYPTGAVQPIPDAASQSEQASVWKVGDPIVEPQGVFQLPDGRLIMSRQCDP